MILKYSGQWNEKNIWTKLSQIIIPANVPII